MEIFNLFSLSDVLTFGTYYNASAGLQDELQTYKDSESKFDTYANPQGAEYDLAKDGEFAEFVVLIGYFVPVDMSRPINALMRKGYRVIETTSEKVFINNLPLADIAWIISGTSTEKKTGGEFYPAYKTVKKEEFVEAVVNYHKQGGALFVWGDNEPLFEHANAVLPHLINADVQLIGNTPAHKTLKIGDGNKTGFFSPHIIFTGVISLYEGVTICYPSNLGCLQVLATSTDNHPVICCADNEALKSDTVGRVMVDCGYTKNYYSWDTAGSARLNATTWLLGLEHKMLHEITIAGKNKTGEVDTMKPSTDLTIHIPTVTQISDKNNNSQPSTKTTTTSTSSISTNSNSSSNAETNNPRKSWWKVWK